MLVQATRRHSPILSSSKSSYSSNVKSEGLLTRILRLEKGRNLSQTGIGGSLVTRFNESKIVNPDDVTRRERESKRTIYDRVNRGLLLHKSAFNVKCEKRVSLPTVKLGYSRLALLSK